MSIFIMVPFERVPLSVMSCQDHGRTDFDPASFEGSFIPDVYLA